MTMTTVIDLTNIRCPAEQLKTVEPLAEKLRDLDQADAEMWLRIIVEDAFLAGVRTAAADLSALLNAVGRDVGLRDDSLEA